MTIETRIDLKDGKYTVVLRSDGAMHALRHGEPWRDLVGDKMVMAMAHEIMELRQVVPADGSVLQRADAWDAVWQQLNGLGAIDTATRGKTGKELATDAIRAIFDQGRRDAELVKRLRDKMATIGQRATEHPDDNDADRKRNLYIILHHVKEGLAMTTYDAVKKNCPPPVGMFPDEDDAAAQAERA